LLDYPK